MVTHCVRFTYVQQYISPNVRRPSANFLCCTTIAPEVVMSEITGVVYIAGHCTLKYTFRVT
jgi:hypothetical protein